MASSIPSWRESPEAWNTLVLNNRIVPGYAQVTFEVKSGLDVRKSPKSHYATIVDQGYTPAAGKIKVTFGFDGFDGYGDLEFQWQSWQYLMAEIFPRRRATRNAYPVTHPIFALAGIDRIYVSGVSSVQGNGPGKRTAEISWIEYGPVTSAAAGEVSGATAKPLTSTDLSTLETSDGADPSVADTGP